MAYRRLLPLDKVPAFGEWIHKQGWTIQVPKGDYEALRATKPGQQTIVIFWKATKKIGNGPLIKKPYATIRHGCPSVPLIRKWIKDEKIDTAVQDTEPYWGGKCEVCQESPIVPATGMCGPCTFGEASTAGGNW